MRVEIIPQNVTLSSDQNEKMQESLHTLRKAVESFRVADLHVNIEHGRKSDSFYLKTILRLPLKTLYSCTQDELLQAAFERCIDDHLGQVNDFKQELHGKGEWQKQTAGTRYEVVPTSVPNIEKLEQAVAEHDYAAFREGISVYDDLLMRRIGRWVQRFRDAESRLGKDIVLNHVLEEVYLSAFENFDQRPEPPLGQWLEKLIHPSLKVLLTSEDERRNVELLGSLDSLLNE